MGLRYSLLLILKLTFAFSTAEPIRGSNVVTANEGEFPFIVSICLRTDHWNVERDHICTGVLISKKHVLTAAHCFKGRLLGEIYIVLGSVDLRNGKRYDPSMWITYDQWIKDNNRHSPFSENDIAIIELSEKVNKEIAIPASLAMEKRSRWFNQNVTIAGWGSTNLNRGRASRYLQKSSVIVLSDYQCERKVFEFTNRVVDIDTNLLCSKAEPYTLIDKGDSGGPVLNKFNKVVAINVANCPIADQSQMESCSPTHDVNVHACLRYYKSFIYDVLRTYSY